MVSNGTLRKTMTTRNRWATHWPLSRYISDADAVDEVRELRERT
jgi:hypothetical protein